MPELKYFQHRSRASLRDIFTTLGLQTENDVVEKVKAADCFSVLLDDSSDVSTIEQMICYVNFWNGNSCDMNFFFIENVLKNASSANAENLYKVVKFKLESLGLDIRKLSGVSTDSASVMVGKKEEACVLPILSNLSKLFPKGNVNFSMICPGLESTQHRLRSLSKEDIFDSLRDDLSPNSRLGTLEITVNEFTMSKLTVTMSKYVDALCRNIDARFQQSPPLAAFAFFFYIRCLPERDGRILSIWIQ
ncbi:unnamed protein product [Mytilus coruscus]|uniref:Uncharacterized protein n=1 Tax=Mytilus coruscus TaxID=42192 RepID=A0A6J8E7W7_MYTCO|nr:unnamed protein product [Mytilus coruscus]